MKWLFFFFISKKLTTISPSPMSSLRMAFSLQTKGTRGCPWRKYRSRDRRINLYGGSRGAPRCAWSPDYPFLMPSFNKWKGIILIFFFLTGVSSMQDQKAKAHSVNLCSLKAGWQRVRWDIHGHACKLLVWTQFISRVEWCLRLFWYYYTSWGDIQIF